MAGENMLENTAQPQKAASGLVGEHGGFTGDLELASLIATRICHDLSGPIGALAAGTEMLDDHEFLGETSALLAHSSAGASARLRMLRAAFGVVNGGVGTLSELVQGYAEALHGATVALGFSFPDANLVENPTVRAVVLNMALLVLDALPGGGALKISGKSDGDKIVLDVDAHARRIMLPAATHAAVQGDRSKVSSRSVQAYWLYCLARPYGGIEVWQSDGALRLSARLPS